ncbi:MAG TPA: ABC transporter permease [Candidatus Polarisedimenticolia bacterium]|nr:ABC transporter permease [Candidatus Polarisedimenticolia bacterium]
MRSILTLMSKDFQRRLAEPAGLLISLAIPLAIAGMMALVFGGGGDSGRGRPPKLRLLVADLDGTPLSDLIKGATQNEEAARYLDLSSVADVEQGLARLREEEFAGLLVIPRGFGEGLLGGRPVEIELIKNPAQTIMPVVAQQGAELIALYLSTAQRLLGDEAPRLKALLLEGKGWDDSIGLAGMLSTLYGRVDAAGGLLMPPLIQVSEVGAERRPGGGSGGGFNRMAWMYPGLLVMGLLFTATTQMGDLLREGRGGTLRRQLAAPVGPVSILVAKVLGVAVLTAGALVAMMALGRLAFGIDWGGRLLPMAAAGAAVVFAITGFSAFLYSVVRTERQGDAVSGIVIMLMSILGGSFIPIQALPQWLQRVAELTLNHWAHDALRRVAAGGGLPEIAGHLALLSAIGVVTVSVGAVLLGRRHVRGAA